MGWNQKIEYIEVEPALPAPVRKQVWDGERFISMTLHRVQNIPTMEQVEWFAETFGPAATYQKGKYWDYSRAGNFTVMDEQVYTWYRLKWNNHGAV